MEGDGELVSSAAPAFEPFGSPAAARDQEQQQQDEGLKQRLFGGGSSSEAAADPCTPAPAAAAAPWRSAGASAEPTTTSLASKEDSAVNYAQFLEETVTWKNKFRSVFYLVGGLLAIGLVYKLLVSSNTFVTGVCYVALAQLALNFMRYFISPSLQAQCTWFDSAWTSAATSYFSSCLKAAASVNDTHMNGAAASKTLRIGLGLWCVSILGRFVSPVQLAVGLWLLGFALPPAYLHFRTRLHYAVDSALSDARARFNAVDKRVRAAAMVLPILIAGYVLSRVDLLIACFLLLVVARSVVQESYVQALHKRVVPLTNTASKLGGRLGSYAVATAERYELTPTPSKPRAKRQ